MAGDNDLETKYKQSVLDIAILQDRIALQCESVIKVQSDRIDLRTHMRDMAQKLQHERQDHRDVNSAFSHQYKTMQKELTNKVRRLEEEVSQLNEKLALCQEELRKEKRECEEMEQDKDATIADLQHKLDNMETHYEKILYYSAESNYASSPLALLKLITAKGYSRQPEFSAVYGSTEGPSGPGGRILSPWKRRHSGQMRMWLHPLATRAASCASLCERDSGSPVPPHSLPLLRLTAAARARRSSRGKGRGRSIEVARRRLTCRLSRHSWLEEVWVSSGTQQKKKKKKETAATLPVKAVHNKLQHCHEDSNQQATHQHHEDAANVLHSQTWRRQWGRAGEDGKRNLRRKGNIKTDKPENEMERRTNQRQTFGAVVLLLWTLATIPPLPLEDLQPIVLLQFENGQVKLITGHADAIALGVQKSSDLCQVAVPLA
ncbi:hypothetical protein INR49_017689, partial [Caranx melampygus]